MTTPDPQLSVALATLPELRQLDVRCALAMGARWYTAMRLHPKTRFLRPEPIATFALAGGEEKLHPWWYSEMPMHASNMPDAFALIAHAHETGWNVEMNQSANDPIWYVQFSLGVAPGILFDATAPTLPECIARAFLAAIEGEKENGK